MLTQVVMALTDTNQWSSEKQITDTITDTQIRMCNRVLASTNLSGTFLLTPPYPVKW